jgi:carbon-monoxide dehydrogenase medium subunit
VLGGSVVTRSVGGGREVAADEFFVTHFTTALAPDELVVEILWPVRGHGWGFAFEELSQRRGDFGVAIAACALRVEDNRVTEARVGVASVTDRPTLLDTELAGEAVTPELARDTAGSAAASLAPFGNLHAPPEYQRHLAGVLIERAVLRAWRNAGEVGS